MGDCIGKVAMKDGATATLDALSAFIPGASSEVALLKLGLNYTSANASGIAGGHTGARIGAVGTATSAATLWATGETAATKFGASTLRAIPIIGTVASGVSLVYDVVSIYNDYNNCRVGKM